MIDLRTDVLFFRLLTDSYRRLTGRLLVRDSLGDEQAARWLYEEAPFAVLAHNTAPDPVFIYGNLAAQNRLEYTWKELTSLPSRLSAEAPAQPAREQFLKRVSLDGFVAGYAGIRISKTGRRFQVENATVWQLIDTNGINHGRAAVLP